ncbi:HET-domain-containing protein [Dactylonectria estremocensis]|uniref:HET-domain-containing protein n=1 Tax=Dactylonectria estremocensis TaxID=1079267 RepID=A0A9P9EI10_9HYPO|nr:HET-domain-containing protein [Dactylonectria estremocensis]
MSQPSIESFKHLIARFTHEIITISSASASLCAQCQPVELRLKEIIKAQGHGFYGGGRDSTNTIVLGPFHHVLSHPGCPLCCLLIRLVLNLKQMDLFHKAKSTGTVPRTTASLQNALLNLYGKVDFQAELASGEAVDGEGTYDPEVNGSWIEYKYANCFQVSVDAIPLTGAISVWLPLEQSDEVNDEESQLFMHPQDYTEIFGDPQNHVSLPRPENGTHRNLELLRDCYDYCNTHHVDCRRSRSSEMPSRLVDMLEMRVKDISQGSSFDYVALSYVWGTAPFITLTSTTSELLRRPNSLQHYSVSLPKAIRDAIHIGKFLGHRYIWIDSLCIKQDDHDDQTAEIRRMHEIYANAGLTIVAAPGPSAQVALLDIEASQLSNQYHTIGGKKFCLDRPELKPLVSFTTWFTRGWTLQELNCSSKIVYFLPERTYYSCNTGSWNEDFPLDPRIPVETYKSSRDEDPKAASFFGSEKASECYVEMAEQLSRRQFTRDEDVLRALSGLYTMFALEKLGPAAAGVPVNFLEAGLMWQPIGRLRRRTASYPDQPPPTWSWAGWAGPVTFPFYRIDGSSIRPIVTWSLYLQTAGDEGHRQYIGVDVVDAVAQSSVTPKSTQWSTRALELRRYPSSDKETSFEPEQAKGLIAFSDPFLLGSVILCCCSRTYKVRIKNITGPELATRAGLQFFSILDSEDNVAVGELKADAGTLEALTGPGTPPSTAELLPIAELDFSSPLVESVLYMNRYSRLGQFSQEFMQVVDQDVNMSIVLWIVHQRELSRRLALGYLTKAGLDRYIGQQNWVALT